MREKNSINSEQNIQGYYSLSVFVYINWQELNVGTDTRKTFRFRTYRSRKRVSHSRVGKTLWKVKNIQETCNVTWRIWELLRRFWRGTRILLCLTYMVTIFYERKSLDGTNFWINVVLKNWFFIWMMRMCPGRISFFLLRVLMNQYNKIKLTVKMYIEISIFISIWLFIVFGITSFIFVYYAELILSHFYEFRYFIIFLFY